MRIDFADWPQTPARNVLPGLPFVILFVGRTGTTFATDVLNQHPDVLCEGEWLGTFKSDHDPSKKQTLWINNLYSENNLQKNKAVGFKTKFFDIPDKEQFRETISRFKPIVIVSLRSNVVKQAISAIRIKALAAVRKSRMGTEEWERSKYGNKIWNIFKEGSGLGQTEIPIDEAKLQVAILEKSNNELYQFVESLNIKAYFYDYEDMLRDEGIFFSKFFSLLGVPSIKYKRNVFKHTPDDLSQSISNFEALKAAFANSKYEAMFGEQAKAGPIG